MFSVVLGHYEHICIQTNITRPFPNIFQFIANTTNYCYQFYFEAHILREYVVHYLANLFILSFVSAYEVDRSSKRQTRSTKVTPKARPTEIVHAYGSTSPTQKKIDTFLQFTFQMDSIVLNLFTGIKSMGSDEYETNRL